MLAVKGTLEADECCVSGEEVWPGSQRRRAAVVPVEVRAGDCTERIVLTGELGRTGLKGRAGSHPLAPDGQQTAI